jgi:hypothetical protein
MRLLKPKDDEVIHKATVYVPIGDYSELVGILKAKNQNFSRWVNTMIQQELLINELKNKKEHNNDA